MTLYLPFTGNQVDHIISQRLKINEIYFFFLLLTKSIDPCILLAKKGEESADNSNYLGSTQTVD